MIRWEYRVFREDNGDYIIREIFYDDKDAIIGCTEDGVEPVGRSLEDLSGQIEAFTKALRLPVLTLSDIPLGKRAEKKHTHTHNISHEQLLAELASVTKVV